MIPTSGKAMQKKMKVVPILESVILILNAEEMISVQSYADGLDLVKISYTTAAGDVYRCTGQINIDTHETEEGRATCTVMPEEDWIPFPA